jgi:hypothetical protein
MLIRWSMAEFVARATARAEELGLTKTGALERKGYPRDILRVDQVRRSLNVENFLKVVDALDWTVEEALGIDAPPRIDPDLLGSALGAIDSALPPGDSAERSRALLHSAAAFYNILVFRRSTGKSLASDADLLAYAEIFLAARGMLPASR